MRVAAGTGVYLKKAAATLSYTMYFGGGRANPLHDRDFVSRSANHSFQRGRRGEPLQRGDSRMNRMFQWIVSGASVLSLLLSVPNADAKVSAEEAKRLQDGTLTPI